MDSHHISFCFKYDEKQIYNTMNNIKVKTILRNYIVLIIGLFIMSWGICLSVRCNLGTTPISAIPNVLSFATGISLGTLTIIFNALLLLIQILILRSKFPRIQLFQLVVTTIFGYFIDFALSLTTNLIPQDTTQQVLLCVLGCFVLALGVFFEVNSHAVVLPGEGVSLAICAVSSIKFEKMKVIFDSTNVIISIILSLYYFGGFVGVGIGTILAGILVGYIIRFYKKIALMILGKNEDNPVTN